MSSPDPARESGALDAEGVFADFVRRRDAGEDLDFEALCSEHRELAEALRVLESLHRSETESVPIPKQTGWVLPIAENDRAEDDRKDASSPDAAETVRYCIQCGRQIGGSPLCTNPDCNRMPNFYLYVPTPDRAERRAPGEGRPTALPPPRPPEPAARPNAEGEPERRTVPVERSPPVALLRCLSSPSIEHSIYPGATEIGARPPARIIIDDAEVSSRHARLDCVRDRSGRWRFVLTDHGSTNGSFVNDQRIERREVKPGDRIRFAGIEFELRPPQEDEPRVTLKR